MLEWINIEDFRGIERLRLELDPRLTVLFGLNASGKTTLFDAIRLALAPLIDEPVDGTALDEVSSGAPAFSDRDVRVGPGGRAAACRIQAQMGGRSWSVRRPPSSDTNEFRLSPMVAWWSSRVSDARDVTDPPAQPQRDADPSWLPFFGAYGSGRGAITIPERERDFRKDFPRWEALDGALDGASPFKPVMEWFLAEEDEERRAKIEREDLDYVRPSLEWVRRAMSAAGPGLSNPRTATRPIRMLVDFRRTPEAAPLTLDLRSLSDGYRAFFGLVIDLARRMVQLNPTADLDHPYKGTNTPAVVLIDEIDLHLHPQWQGSVVPGLLEAFPQTQFIITTHSEQVLASVPRRHVRKLVHDGVDLRVEPVAFAQGASSERILAALMDVPPFVPGAVQSKLRSYLGLVAQGEGAGDEARRLREELEADLPGDPLLERADRVVARQLSNSGGAGA